LEALKRWLYLEKYRVFRGDPKGGQREELRKNGVSSPPSGKRQPIMGRGPG